MPFIDEAGCREKMSVFMKNSGFSLENFTEDIAPEIKKRLAFNSIVYVPVNYTRVLPPLPYEPSNYPFFIYENFVKGIIVKRYRAFRRSLNLKPKHRLFVFWMPSVFGWMIPESGNYWLYQISTRVDRDQQRRFKMVFQNAQHNNLYRKVNKLDFDERPMIDPVFLNFVFLEGVAFIRFDEELLHKMLERMPVSSWLSDNEYYPWGFSNVAGNFLALFSLESRTYLITVESEVNIKLLNYIAIHSKLDHTLRILLGHRNLRNIPFDRLRYRYHSYRTRKARKPIPSFTIRGFVYQQSEDIYESVWYISIWQQNELFRRRSR